MTNTFADEPGASIRFRLSITFPFDDVAEVVRRLAGAPRVDT